MPLETSADSPVPVRRVSQLLADWIHRLGAVWVEGQVTQVTRRPGTRTAFLTLRDPAADVSLPVSVERALLDAMEPPVREGLQVVLGPLRPGRVARSRCGPPVLRQQAHRRRVHQLRPRREQPHVPPFGHR